LWFFTEGPLPGSFARYRKASGPFLGFFIQDLHPLRPLSKASYNGVLAIFQNGRLISPPPFPYVEFYCFTL
jgi:hypothetical protein